MKNRFREHMRHIFSGRGVDRHFMTSRSRADEIEHGARRPAPDDASAPGEPARRKFSGERFIQQAMEQLDRVSAFGALAVKPDRNHPRPSDPRKDDLPHFTATLCREIDQLCRGQNGLCGQVDADTAGCFLPGADAAACVEAAKRIQAHVFQQLNKRVSIGMALFPMADFGKDDIMDNAAKALVHAGFLGSGSRVMFDAVSLNISGDACYQNGDLAAAVREFQNALKIDGADLNVLNSLGVCFGVQGELEKALGCFEGVMALDAGHVMARYNAGYVCRLMGRNEAAMAYLLEADEAGEEVFEVAFQIGALYMAMGDPARARTFFQKALAANPDGSVVHCHLGDCAEALGERETAVVHYQTAVKKNPNDAAALSALGWLYDQKGENCEISLLFCEKSVEIAPQNGLFQHRLGTVYANNRMMEKARGAFENALKFGYGAASDMERLERGSGDGPRERLSN